MEPDPIFYETTVQERICSFLNFEDAVRLRDYLGLSELTCPILVEDVKNQSVILPGVNDTTIRIFELLQRFDVINLLFNAVEEGNIPIFSVLLKATKTDINFQDDKQWTFLTQAARFGNSKMVNYLLDMGADINKVASHNRTALLYAVDNVNVEVIKILLKRGANTEISNSLGSSPLDYAAKKGLNEILLLLLQFGANIEGNSIVRWTPLMTAAVYDHIETMKLLIEKGANVNATMNDGTTVLMIIIANRKIEAIEILLETGKVDVSAINNNGFNAVDYINTPQADQQGNYRFNPELRQALTDLINRYRT